jgi:transcription antitermination factor NusG
VIKGAIVTIIFGPFAGLSGEVVAITPERTMVRMILKGRSILVEVDTDMIRALGRSGMRRPAEPPAQSRPA